MNTPYDDVVTAFLIGYTLAVINNLQAFPGLVHLSHLNAVAK